MRNKNTALLLWILLIFSMPLASAGIMISQPKPDYNLGDSLEIQLEVDELKEGYFDVDMICADILNGSRSQASLYHGILDKKIIQITRALIPLYINNLAGRCYIEARYAADIQTSQNFEISKTLDVSLELNEFNYKAGQAVRIKGRAIQKNGRLTGQNAAAYVNVLLGNESKTSGIVKDGQFDVNFTISESTNAGSNVLIVEVYDEDFEGNRLNSGEARADLTVTQEPSWMDIAVDKQIVVPGESIKIIPLLYDKANNKMSGEEILLKITDSNSKAVFEKIVSTDAETIFTSEYNLAAGRAVITAKKEAENIAGEKALEVEESPKVNVQIINSTAIVTNIGNAPYDKTVEIAIGDRIFLKEVKLQEGQKIEYELSAPDGEYTLAIKDEYGIIHEGGVALTGNAISVEEIGIRMNILLRYPLAWIFLILIIAAVIFVVYKNNKKRHSYAFHMEKSAENFAKRKEKMIKNAAGSAEKMLGEAGKMAGKAGHALENVLDLRNDALGHGGVTRAEQVLVLTGRKDIAGILALRIKNQIGKVAKEALHRAIKTAREHKGIPCQVGCDFLIIFSPLVSRTMRNSENAIKSAQEIAKELNEHNKKFRDKLDFGIGVNTGEIINKIEAGKLKFTSIGPTINLAKRIACISKGGVLMSKSAHEKTKRDVKTEAAINESRENKMELFRIKKIIDGEMNEKFIQNFLRKL